MSDLAVTLQDEQATLELAARWAPLLSKGAVVYLEGDLGAGKTCFSRGLIQALGHDGKVKSPTYTLVEDYQLPAVHVYHFDLYRLGDAEELEYMGIREYLDRNALVLVEWPQRGQGFLPAADLVFQLAHQPPGRLFTARARTGRGAVYLRDFIAAKPG